VNDDLMDEHLIDCLADDLWKAVLEMRDPDGSWTWRQLADYLVSVGWTNG
jgi:hypothetical protein